jgi:hypothetical protein
MKQVSNALLSIFTRLLADCTILHPCPTALPGSLARKPCLAALPGILAWQPWPAALPGSLGRQPCPAALPGSLARKPCRKITSIITGVRSHRTVLQWQVTKLHARAAVLTGLNLFLVQFHHAFIICMRALLSSRQVKLVQLFLCRPIAP